MDFQTSDWIDAPELQPAGREYAIGDVHGFAEPLEAVLRAMGESAARAGQGHLTFLGDLIDKGPDPAGALKLATRPGEGWGFTGKTLLVGNHDLFLLLAMEDIDTAGHIPLALWRIAKANGFGDTLNQLGVDDSRDLRTRLIELLGEEGLAQIDRMEGVRASGTITFSHAGPGWYYGLPADEWFAQPPRFRGFIDGSEAHYTWTRFWWTCEPIDPGVFVHGHTPERLIWGRRHGDRICTGSTAGALVWTASAGPRTSASSWASRWRPGGTGSTVPGDALWRAGFIAAGFGRSRDRLPLPAGHRPCSCYVPGMPSATARDSRVVRLRDAATPSEGYVRLAICTGCGHRDALPFDRLLRRFGPDHPIADALSVLRCSACGMSGAVRFQLTRICDGECRANGA